MSAEKRLAATIEVMESTMRPGDELRYRISNTGSVELVCGLSYRLEREAAEGWVPMNADMAFRAIGFGVLPGESRELTATIPGEGPPGFYRLSTLVTSDHAEGDVALSARFDVHPNG